MSVKCIHVIVILATPEKMTAGGGVWGITPPRLHYELWKGDRYYLGNNVIVGQQERLMAVKKQ